MWGCSLFVNVGNGFTVVLLSSTDIREDTSSAPKEEPVAEEIDTEMPADA